MPTESASFDDGRVTTYRDDDVEPKADTTERAIDPVCGMEVSTTDPTVKHAELEGQAYYFCSEDCRDQFEADPDQFAVPASAP